MLSIGQLRISGDTQQLSGSPQQLHFSGDTQKLSGSPLDSCTSRVTHNSCQVLRNKLHFSGDTRKLSGSPLDSCASRVTHDSCQDLHYFIPFDPRGKTAPISKALIPLRLKATIPLSGIVSSSVLKAAMSAAETIWIEIHFHAL